MTAAMIGRLATSPSPCWPCRGHRALSRPSRRDRLNGSAAAGPRRHYRLRQGHCAAYQDRVDRTARRASPIAAFLERNPAGGIGRICYEFADVALRLWDLAWGARVLGSVKIGAHGKPVVFVHPKDFLGTLIELEEA